MFKRVCTALLILAAVLLTSAHSQAGPLPAPIESGGDKYWIQSLSESYGLSADDVRALHKKGMEWKELREYLESVYPHEPITPGTEEFVALAEQTGITPLEAIKAYEFAVKYRRDPVWLASLYLECGDWNKIASAFKRYDMAVSARNKARFKGALKDKSRRVVNALKNVYGERAYEIDQLMVVSDEDRVADILFFADVYSGGAFEAHVRTVEHPTQLDLDSMDALPDMSGLHKPWPERRFPAGKLDALNPDLSRDAQPLGEFGFILMPGLVPPEEEPAAQMRATSFTPPAPSLVPPSGIYDTGNVSPFKSYFEGHAESIDPSSGSVTIRQTDFTLPGKHGLDFTLTRTYNN